MSEIIFIVEDDAESGYCAQALGESIFTEADSLDETAREHRRRRSVSFLRGERSPCYHSDNLSRKGDLTMNWRIALELDPETGDYAVSCPELPGCTSAGATEEEALENIREAIALYLEA
jgi:hypothetical protein